MMGIFLPKDKIDIIPCSPRFRYLRASLKVFKGVARASLSAGGVVIFPDLRRFLSGDSRNGHLLERFVSAVIPRSSWR